MKLLVIIFSMVIPSLICDMKEEEVLSVDVYSMSFGIETRYGYGFSDVIQSVKENVKNDKKQYHIERVTSKKHVNQILDCCTVKEKNYLENTSSDLRLVVVINYKDRSDTIGYDFFRVMKVGTKHYQNEDCFATILKYTNCHIRKSAKR